MYLYHLLNNKIRKMNRLKFTLCRTLTAIRYTNFVFD